MVNFFRYRFLCFFPSSIYVFEHNNVDSAELSDIYEHFSYFLSRYLTASGELVELTTDEMKDIIYTQNNNIEHFSYNINAIRECAEQIILDSDSDKNLVISSTSENNFIATCYDSINCTHINGYDNTDALDWGYAVGEALAGMTAQINFYGGKYHMDLKYYLIDTYEFPSHWTKEDHEDSLTKTLHGFHEAAFAKEYKIIGCYEISFEWEKGEILLEENYNPNIKVDVDALNEEPIN